MFLKPPIQFPSVSFQGSEPTSKDCIVRAIPDAGVPSFEVLLGVASALASTLLPAMFCKAYL